MKIPIISGRSFFRFRVTLSERNFVFIVKWSTRFSFFSVDIYEDNVSLIMGRGLHPDIDLLYGLNLDIGSVILVGEVPTISNLGVSNELEYTSV